MATYRGADIIADYLIREGVPYAVGVCGHGNIGLLDAFYRRQGEIIHSLGQPQEREWSGADEIAEAVVRDLSRSGHAV